MECIVYRQELGQKASAKKITIENTTFAWSVVVYSFLRLYIWCVVRKTVHMYTELDNQGLNYLLIDVFNYVRVVIINTEYYLRNMEHL
jgi:hypothetical protein